MAVRDILKTDSIDFLIYREVRGEFKGYKIDLLTEETLDNIKKIIFCCQCGGISRKPRLADGETFCTPCSPMKNAIVDVKSDEIVLQLKSRCPLSTRGCDWLGQLGDIEQHMRVCEKLRIDCEIGCGEVLERWETDEHLKKCPLRRERCEFCGEEVEASKANRHIALCPRHPDGEVLCPYKELGCDVLGIQRKNLDTHLADNSIGHQKLVLKEIYQLRNQNDKQRNAADNSIGHQEELLKEIHQLRSAADSAKNRDVVVHKRAWTLLSVVVLGIALLALYLHTEIDRIHVNERSIQSNEQSVKFLMSNSYLHDYIEDRGKTLRGVEWAHKNAKDETYYGPIFYLGNCKLRLHVNVFDSVGRSNANYHITRFKGNSDDVSNTCHISYIHLYSVNTRNDSRDSVGRRGVSERLKVGDECWINRWFVIDEDTTVPTRKIRVYFDFD